MSEAVFSHGYNLNRLGQAGDEVRLETTDEQRVSLAHFAGILRVEEFLGRVQLKKLSSDRFELAFDLKADLVQACVVSLAEVPAHIEKHFLRELHFNPALRRAELEAEIPLDDDLPEEIDSLHYDLAGPLIEEFILSLEPYPRAPGVEFHAPGGGGLAPENPFAVLKGLKSGL